ncbi:hypothetical protein MHYP_G00013490 [Metynnis hypsauchen]
MLPFLHNSLNAVSCSSGGGRRSFRAASDSRSTGHVLAVPEAWPSRSPLQRGRASGKRRRGLANTFSLYDTSESDSLSYKHLIIRLYEHHSSWSFCGEKEILRTNNPDEDVFYVYLKYKA